MVRFIIQYNPRQPLFRSHIRVDKRKSCHEAVTRREPPDEHNRLSEQIRPSDQSRLSDQIPMNEAAP